MHFDVIGSLSAFGSGLVGYLLPFLFVLNGRASSEAPHARVG